MNLNDIPHDQINRFKEEARKLNAVLQEITQAEDMVTNEKKHEAQRLAYWMCHYSEMTGMFAERLIKFLVTHAAREGNAK